MISVIMGKVSIRQIVLVLTIKVLSQNLAHILNFQGLFVFISLKFALVLYDYKIKGGVFVKTNFKVSKKIISLVRTALLVLSMISVSGFSAFAEESADILPELSATIDTGEEITLSDADGDGYYDINNADELYAFAALVNDGNTAINGKILKDFVVNEGLLTSESTDVRAWTPIGNNSNRYSGTFDGNGCVVAGLYFNDSSAFDIGFFGCIGASGVVKNIEVNANYFCASSFVGGIAGMEIERGCP